MVDSDELFSEWPYPGLRPFRRHETDIFFGREEHTDQLLEQLSSSRFLAVVGPSGCGKSSLVGTGLVPALYAGFLGNVGPHWRVAEFRPRDQPMQYLADALLDAGLFLGPAGERDDAARARLLAELRRGPRALSTLCSNGGLPNGTNLLLSVDQFEEVFRYKNLTDSDEADAFVSLIVESSELIDVPIYVIVSMRSDFLGECARFPGLPEAVNAGLFLTPRMNRDQLTQTIVGPAAVFDATLDPKLVNQLLNTVGREQSRLPVLQHSLMRMWRQVNGPNQSTLESATTPIKTAITTEQYRAIGGMGEALSRHADKAFGELDADQQILARKLFCALTDRHEFQADTRRPEQLAKIADICAVDWQTLAQIADVFRQSHRSFLTPTIDTLEALTPNTLLDIGHESLIRNWHRLDRWVEAESRSADQYRRLLQQARLWQEGKAALWQPPDLQIALNWKKAAEPSTAWASRYGGELGLVEDFLNESSAQQKRDRAKRSRDRLFRFGVPVLGVFLAAVVYYSSELEQTNNTLADKNDELADTVVKLKEVTVRRIALTLSADSAEYAKDRPDLALLLGLEAINLSDQPKVWRGLLAGLKASTHLENVSASLHGNRVFATAFSRDSALVASAGRDRRIIIRQVDSGYIVDALPEHHHDVISDLAFSNDMLVSGSWDGSVKLWSLSNKRLNSEFRIDNRELASPSQRSNVTQPPSAMPRVISVAVTPDARMVFASTNNGQLCAWETRANVGQCRTMSDWTDNALKSETNSEVHISLAEDGGLLAAGWGTNRATWSLAETTNVGDSLILEQAQSALRSASKTGLNWTDDDITDIAMGRDKFGAEVLITGHRLGRVVYGSPASTKVIELGAHKDGVLGVAVHSNHVVSGGKDSRMHVWDLAHGQELSRNTSEDWVRDVAFSPNGDWISGAIGSGAVTLWDTTKSARLAQPLIEDAQNPPGEYWSSAGSPNGQWIAIGGDRSPIRLWNLQRGEQIKLETKARGGIVSLAFTADSNGLIAGDLAGNFTFWRHQPNTGWSLVDTYQMNAPVTNVAAAGDWLAVGLHEAPAELWKWNSQTAKYQRTTQLDSLAEHALHATGWGDSIAIHEPTQTLAIPISQGSRYQIELIDLTTGQLVSTLDGKRRGHTAKIFTLRFNDAGDQLISGGEDNRIIVWDLNSGSPKYALEGHTNRVNGLTLNDDESLLISVSRDGSVALWDLVRRERIITFENHTDFVNAISWVETESKFVTVGDDGRAFLWNADKQAWRRSACLAAGRIRLTEEEWTKHFPPLPAHLKGVYPEKPRPTCQ